MESRSLGRTGVRVSPLVLGTANFGDPTPEHEAARMIDRALDADINLIDTANSYAEGESERMIGRALGRNGRRNGVLIATKFHFPVGPGPNDRGNSRFHIQRACEDSLRRLDIDCIDLYQAHRPSLDIPIEETLGALTDLVRQGKVRYIGCSTAPAWKTVESILVAERNGLSRFVTEQPPYNLLDRRIENELLPMCQRYGLGVLTWSPMAMGLLAGRYEDTANLPIDSRASRRGGVYSERITARGIEVGRRFAQLAREHGVSPAQLAVLWVKDQPGVTAPLIGPRNLDQLEHLLPVLEMELSVELRSACDGLVPPGSVVVSFHNSADWMKARVAL